MQLVNTEYITGKELEMLGLVVGNTVQSRNIGRDITQGLRNIDGGELKAYTELLALSRTEATDRMIAEAEKLGADAIINVRYSSASIVQGGAEVVAYGTAVRFR
jgi:uncharacterized protein YbjQ (UPF0145 family)